MELEAHVYSSSHTLFQKWPLTLNNELEMLFLQCFCKVECLTALLKDVKRTLPEIIFQKTQQSVNLKAQLMMYLKLQQYQCLSLYFYIIYVFICVHTFKLKTEH